MEREEPPSDRVFVDAANVARRWNVNKDYVYRIVRQGRLPSYRIGKHLRFDPADVAAFEQRVDATA